MGQPPAPQPQPPEPPWKRATQKRRSMRSENDAAKLEGGRRVPMSGAGKQKGDVNVRREWLIEDKYTDAQSFTVTTVLLDKIVSEALRTPPGLLPQVRITLPGHKWRMLREEDYLYLQALAEQNKLNEDSFDA